MHKMTDRKEIDTFINLNENRFETINKSPTVLSSIPKLKSFSIDKGNGRTNLFPSKETSRFYDAKKEVTMKKLDAGILSWEKSYSSRSNSVFNNTYTESYDYENAMQAITKNLKPRISNLTNFKR